MLEDKSKDYEVVRRAVCAEPRVSVLMGVYNDEAGHLQASLESLQAQTMSEWELICVDDASCAAVAQLLENFAAADDRVTLVRHRKNLGLTRALIHAVQESRAPIMARQDSDDLSFPHRFARQLKFFPAYDLVCAQTWVNDLRISPRWFTVLVWRWALASKNPFIHGTWMFTRAVYDAIGGYNAQMRYAQDYDLAARWVIRGIRVKYLMEPLYCSYKDSSGVSIRYRAAQQEYFDKVRKKMGGK